ncbi:Hypothetical predicted protein [Drosophila guanche]|uniref:MD-2-related lipid-recognition domain-containing protein n=1 Tax=Drosophila guanche TaxID=7266 RepID=A0A3B0JY90_DROGU|nr:Hypothetical predicted protein [Drosophila guanche]
MIRSAVPSKMWRLLVFVLWIALHTICLSHVTFTNLKCTTFDAKYVEFPTCQIKAVNRSHKYVDISTKLQRLPIRSAWVKVKFMKLDHGYKPFFIDLSYDACKFLKDMRRHPIAFMFFRSFMNSSNLNHTCPYNHDVIVDKLYTGELETEFSRLMPIPNGDYAIYTDWSTENTPRASVRIYMKILRN